MVWLLRSAIVMTYPRIPGLPGIEDCALDANNTQNPSPMAATSKRERQGGVFDASKGLLAYLTLRAILPRMRPARSQRGCSWQR